MTKVKSIKARLRLKTTDEGGRFSGIKTSYRPNHVFEYNDKGNFITTYIGQIDFDKEWIQLGEEEEVTVTFILDPSIENYLTVGRHWWIHEGKKLVGEAEIIEV
jgi:translation elongation factor EF-Tu-like GTPase